MVKYLNAPCFLLALLLILANACRRPAVPVYPKIVGYFSVVNPIEVFDKTGFSLSFANGYTVGFPTGINILKSDKLGFSFEVTPLSGRERR